jgi:guanylate kinase
VTPFPVILSAPSGGGKTTIAKEVLRRRADVGYSVSCTTRLPRPGEVDGRDYYFLNAAEFRERRARGEFAESADVHGSLYGTLRSEVQRILTARRHVLMDIDVQGARQFRDAFPGSVLIFLLPPSADVLLERLRARRTEDPEGMARRLASALAELRAAEEYEYVIVNDELEGAVHRVSAIIDAETARRGRLTDLERTVEELVRRLEQEITPTYRG